MFQQASFPPRTHPEPDHTKRRLKQVHRYAFAFLATAALAQPPQFTRESVLPAGGRRAEPLRAGMLVSIYGRHLAPGCPSPAPRKPYPTELCGVRVTVAGKTAGLLAVLESQINLEVPAGVPEAGDHPVVIFKGDISSGAVLVPFGLRKATLALKDTAYVGMPIWLYIERPHPDDVRYPYESVPWAIGEAELDATSNGRPLQPWRPSGIPGGVAGGLRGGSSAPAGSPRSRLPLHVLYRFDQPGRYAVRYRGYWWGEGFKREVYDQSDWFNFDVLPPQPELRGKWLREQMARAGSASAGELAGDILPSLIAGADPAVIPVYLMATNHPEPIVQQFAGTSLTLFDQVAVDAAIETYVRKHGPTPTLARRLTGPKGVFAGRDSALLDLLDQHLAKPGTLQTILAMRHQRSELRDRLDRMTIHAADRMLPQADPLSLQLLAEALGMTKNDSSRERLWKMIDGGMARSQALICLTWIGDSRDLPRLANLLEKADAKDPLGYGQSGLPYALRRAYGETALPYLRDALRGAPQLWVRKECAVELALAGYREGFAELLKVMEQQPSARPEILNFGRDRFPELKHASDDAVIQWFQNRSR